MLTKVCYVIQCHEARRLSQKQYFDWIWNSMKFCHALIHIIFDWSHWNFAHIKTVTLPWCMQIFIVIHWAYLKPEHCKIWSNFEFDEKKNICETGTMSDHCRSTTNQQMQWKNKIHGLVQERFYSIANALELHHSCTNPSKWWCVVIHTDVVNEVCKIYR